MENVAKAEFISSGHGEVENTGSPAYSRPLMFTGIDLFSDTLSHPSEAMKQAMITAPLGDEQKGEDPTTLALEKRAAELLGKGASLFFPSSTMANEVAIMALVNRGDELIAAENAHVLVAEAGGPAFHAGAQTVAIPTQTGKFTGEELRKYFRPMLGHHLPITGAVSVENTTNLGGGLAWTKHELTSVLDTAAELKIKTHLDGSRIFNAALASGLTPKEIASRFDAVTVCFSKGLGCPTGAILAFDPSLFLRIRRLKQVMGGGMRQSGILAAAALFALENPFPALQKDHENADYFRRHLQSNFPDIGVEVQPLSTNIVFFSWLGRMPPAEFLSLCTKQGVRFSQIGENRFRAVTYNGISRENIDRALNLLNEVCKQ